MHQATRNVGELRWANLFGIASLTLLLAGPFALGSAAQQAGQKTFSSAQAASSALLTAAQSNDEKAMLDVLGPEGKRIVSSGDDTEDTQDRTTFIERYQQVHRLVKEPNGETTLYVGPENWPFPIPLANKGGAWYFDTATGKREILYRRVGRNEMSTITVCEQLVAAQKEYFSTHNEYARNIFSHEGQQNGLYWRADAGQPQSPIGPLVASAVAEGYTPPPAGGAPSTPYRGYYYRVLTRQGAGGAGGAKDYVAGGKMTGGFAFVAYPAEYKSSGVMTFLVDEDGVVYRKNLGPNTVALAKAMKAYNPDATWKKDEDQQEEQAAQASN